MNYPEHDCWDNNNNEQKEVSAPCPHCPDGMWQAVDEWCGVCGQPLSISGHVHGGWLARSGMWASDVPDSVPPAIAGWPDERQLRAEEN